MKTPSAMPLKYQRLSAALLSVVLFALVLPMNLRAEEDPPGCSLPNGGQGNVSQGGINFNLPQAHLGDSVPLFASLGMVSNACRAINATGSIYLATGKLTNFLVNVTLDPGLLVSCPANALCQPGPYNVLITPALVGAGVSSPNGSISGMAGRVRAVENGEGTVQTGDVPELLADFHTATISIVTPCIQVVKLCAYPAGTNCFAAGAPIQFTGYVTNCGDIRLTNVTVVDDRTVQLFDTSPAHLPLFQPMTLEPGQAVSFQGSFIPTLAETCAGSATDTITVRGTDTTVIGGPNASVTNQTTTACNICVTPCLTVTKDCTPATFGQPQTVSGVVANCGNITITNITVSDDVYGPLTTLATLAPGASLNYSKTFSATQCGATTSTVTAAGFSVCGTSVQARATNTCSVVCPPCLKVDKTIACAIGTSCGPFGEVATGMKGDHQNPAFCYSITVSNCGSISLTNAKVVDDKLGDLSASYFAGPATVFPVGASLTRIFKASWPTNTTGTVVASGQSSFNGSGVSDTNDAVALVLPASVTCNLQVSSPDDVDGNPNDRHISLRDDGAAHNVTFTITATAGNAPLANLTISSPVLAVLGCALPGPF